ncbi:hypothetical protein FSARC_10480 [Fusarium sarcochroum]|uniref:ER-bound oxygenase mpaB/mpaB'/Rubber oxygenase catalytic domain-containing protein n=1 Tax=Fusarium sarcochroum TaxID=1208366 RepID=A0A8H4TM49_9HYPO|nr:hypothetical protein FSARC_10480 [Fusarium sarcochroum]
MSGSKDWHGKNLASYKLDISNRLPPGTEDIDQLTEDARQPRLPAKLKRPLPEWPPVSQRKGKWISRYFDQLDPETEYDQLIRTANFFTGTSFAVAIGYCSTFIHLTQTPAGAAAIHSTGKSWRVPHQRFYETQNRFLDWMWYGSGSQETKDSIEAVNKLHAGLWRRLPGTFSTPWEGQMSVIGSAYFETFLRKLAGARNQEPHPHLAAAWPIWAERVLAQFNTEPLDGSWNYGVNFPRNWEELEAFYKWYQELPFDQWTSVDDRKKGHKLAVAFIEEFSTCWFPRQLRWLGRQVLLTVVTPKVRDQQQIGHPNPIIERFVKLGFKIMFDLTDILPDPTKPDLLEEYQAVKNWEWHKIDDKVNDSWKRHSRHIDIAFATCIILLAAFVLAWG